MQDSTRVLLACRHTCDDVMVGLCRAGYERRIESLDVDIRWINRTSQPKWPYLTTLAACTGPLCSSQEGNGLQLQWNLRIATACGPDYSGLNRELVSLGRLILMDNFGSLIREVVLLRGDLSRQVSLYGDLPLSKVASFNQECLTAWEQNWQTLVRLSELPVLYSAANNNLSKVQREHEKLAEEVRWVQCYRGKAFEDCIHLHLRPVVLYNTPLVHGIPI